MSEFRAHGANPGKLYGSLGIAVPERVIDFSTNTNALPCPGWAELDPARLLSDYPDDESLALRNLLAERNGCAAEEILVTNGSNEAVYLLASYCAGEGANAVLQPAYGEYARALGAWGAVVKNIFSLSGLEDGDRSLWLCNPCNPSGSWIAAADIVQASLARPDTLFVVDEAYIDFLLTGGPGLNPAGLPPNLVLLRSLTKIYHLCGVRAGYVVADRQIIKKLKRRQPTWSVNSVAQAAAEAFLRDDDYPRRTRMFYRAETPRFIESIKNAGFNVLPTCVNFFLVETGEDERLIRFLLKRGLVVRHTRNFPGLDGGYVRIATRLPEENELLAAALREFKA